jgi:hypothetical protein
MDTAAIAQQSARPARRNLPIFIVATPWMRREHPKFVRADRASNLARIDGFDGVKTRRFRLRYARAECSPGRREAGVAERRKEVEKKPWEEMNLRSKLRHLVPVKRREVVL